MFPVIILIVGDAQGNHKLHNNRSSPSSLQTNIWSQDDCHIRLQLLYAKITAQI